MDRKERYVINIFRIPSPYYFFNVFVRGADFHMARHSHGRFHVNTVMEGNVDVITSLGKMTVRAGEAYVMPPGVEHELRSKEGYFQIGMDVLDVLDEYGLVERLHAISEGKAVKVAIARQGTLDYVTEETLTDMSPLSQLRCINRMSEHLIDILESGDRERKRKNFRIQFIEAAAQVNGRGILLDELCRKMNFSKTHLERLVRQEFGCSVMEYMNRLRYLKVCSLLTATDQTLAEIAEVCGFYDSAHLCVFFKRYSGITPSAYRKGENDEKDS